MKLRTFTVEGTGDFPIDMLRYDACWPATPTDSAVIQYKNTERRVVLEMMSSFPNTPKRWESFGWAIVEGGRV